MTSVTASTINSPVSWRERAAALMLRLGLMPLFFHNDLNFIQVFPWHWSYRGIPDIYGHFADTFLKQGFTYYHPLVFWAVGVWQMITRPLAAGFDGWMVRAAELMHAGGSEDLSAQLEGFAAWDVVRWVVLAKMMYLAADLCCWPLIRSISRRDAALRGLERAWMLHPVLLFAVYAFGQYRILPALTVWAAAFFLQRGQKVFAAAALGCVLLLDNFGLLILAPTVLIWGDGWRERLKLLTVLLIPALVVVVPWALISEGYVLSCYFSPLVQRVATQGIFRSMGPEGALAFKGLFAVLWTLVLIAAWRARARSSEDRMVLWCAASAAVLLALYATSSTTIHYFMWVLPFWLVLGSKKVLRPGWLLATVVALLFFFNLDSRSMNLGLLTHLHPGLASAPSLHEVMDRHLPWGKVIGLARLAFTVLSLLCVFRSLKYLDASRSERTAA